MIDMTATTAPPSLTPNVRLAIVILTFKHRLTYRELAEHTGANIMTLKILLRPLIERGTIFHSTREAHGHPAELSIYRTEGWDGHDEVEEFVDLVASVQRCAEDRGFEEAMAIIKERQVGEPRVVSGQPYLTMSEAWPSDVVTVNDGAAQ